VLSVGVHHQHRVAARGLQPGQQGRLVAEVAREAHADHLRPCLLEVRDRLPRRIATAVVDDDNLMRGRAERPRDLGHDDGQGVRLVVRGQNHRDLRVIERQETVVDGGGHLRRQITT
jgi:hypothetical protein